MKLEKRTASMHVCVLEASGLEGQTGKRPGRGALKDKAREGAHKVGNVHDIKFLNARKFRV